MTAGDTLRDSLDFGWFRRLPMVRQCEVADCGLACLAMVAGYHGNRTELGELRRRFQPSGQGLTLRQLVDLSGHLGFSARPLRAELGAVGHLQRPCILHWDLNHFVVLKRLGRRHAVIHDPALGVRRLDETAFSRHFTGIALELTPNARFECRSTAARLRLSDLWTRIIGIKRSLLQLLALSLLMQLYAIAAPFFMQTVVDDVVLRGDTGLLATLAFGFGLLLLIETGTQALRSSAILFLSSRMHLQLAANLFHHLVRLPLDFFQRRHLGDVLSRFSSLEAVREILSTGLVTALVDGLMALVMLVVMLFYEVHLTLVVLACLALYTAIRFLWLPTLRSLTQQSIGQHALSETSLIESIRAIQTVKLFQREGERQALWQNRLADAMNTDIHIARLGIGFTAANTLLLGLENILVIYFAAKAVMGNVISMGMLFAFMSYKQRFVSAVDGLVNQLVEIRMLGLHLQRISDIAHTRPEQLPPPASGETPGSRSALAIGCRDLAFRHSPMEPWIFEGLTLDIPAGSCVAIAGPSGVGKSTLLKCLMGLIPPSEGEVLVDGTPVVHRPEFRSQLAAVMQDDQLLGGTIAENIACFDHQLDMAFIAECASIARIHADVMAMPMQYNTPVGDMGSALSGGQVQRIMLARAVYRRPGILFLDEATSHLDLGTEQAINRHIADMQVTRVIVAHRPETIALADKVIQLRRDSRITVSRIGD